MAILQGGPLGPGMGAGDGGRGWGPGMGPPARSLQEFPGVSGDHVGIPMNSAGRNQRRVPSFCGRKVPSGNLT